jgi:hypothetical protein
MTSDAPAGSIPPIPDPATGLPTCPEGYYYVAAYDACVLPVKSSVDMNDPQTRKAMLDLGATEVDPKLHARLTAEGFKESGIIERFIVGLLEIPLHFIRPLVEIAASVLDDALTVLAQIFLSAQGQSSSGFYRLAAALMEDMVNIPVDGDKMFADFQAKGRVAAMQDLGGAVFDTLAGEFVGTRQTDSNGLFITPTGKGIGGLQQATLTPESGIRGAKGFLGFMTAFAVREGNTDILAELIPHGYGRVFKDFAEDFAKGLGIGRMGRMIWKNLVNVTVATPMLWALNKEYRPTLLSPTQAFRAFHQQIFDPAALAEELARHGLSADRQRYTEWESMKGPDRPILRTLHIAERMDDDNYRIWNRRINHTDEVTGLLDQAEDIDIARRAALDAVRLFAHQYLTGRIPRETLTVLVNGVQRDATGRGLLSQGEVDSLNALPVIASVQGLRHLSVSQNMRLYLDGVITLGEFETALTNLGFDADTVQEEAQEVLLMQRRLSDRAARSAATAARGPLWHLSIAQLEAGLAQGLVSDAEIRAELHARHYTPEAVNAAVAEMYAKAKIPPPPAPQA